MKLATIPAATAAKAPAANTHVAQAATIPPGLANFDLLPESAFVGSDVVRGLYRDITLTTLWRWTKSQRVPAPCKLAGQRFNAWNVGELRRALAVEAAK